MDDFLSIVRGLDFTKLIQKLDLGPTTLFVGLILVFLIIYGLSLGRTKALMSLLSIYIALAFDATFPYLNQLHNLIGLTKDIYTTRIIVFLLVYFLAFAVLNNSFARTRFTLKESSIVTVAAISLAQIGLLIAVIANIIPGEILKKMPEYLSAYFGTKQALFYWIILPIIVLLFLRKEKRRNSVE